MTSDGTVSTSATSGLTGYTVVNADSMEAAVGLAKGCPLSDGGVIDIYETVDM